jgi:hypothetical protein
MILDVTLEIPGEVDIIGQSEDFPALHEVEVLENILNEVDLHGREFVKALFWNLIAVVFVHTSSPTLEEASGLLDLKI